MTPNRYSSFDEIDRRLKILSLQREIDKESFKLNLYKSKNSLYPTNLVGGLGGLLQKVLVSLAVKKLLKKRRQAYKEE